MTNFGYFIKEAVDSLFTNKTGSFTTLMTVVLSLVITGLFQIVSLNIVSISKDLGDKFEFNIFIKEEVPTSQLETVKNQIISVDMVNEVVLKTKEQTLNEVKNKLGETSVLKGLSEENNPFRNCYKVTVSDLSKSESIISEIKKIESVDSVSNNIDASKQVLALKKNVGIYSWAAYLILAILCLSIIANIINSSIFSRRKHINIMKYVGATNSFIKSPFIIEGIMIGFLGAVISTAVLLYGYSFVYKNFNQVLEGIYLIKPTEVFAIVFLANTAFSLIIGALGAGFSVNKHLKV
jgi:cell division transport system permease protein